MLQETLLFQELLTEETLQTDGTKLDGFEASATADQPGAEIKSAYEGEADTNAFTDALYQNLVAAADDDATLLMHAGQ